MTTTLNAIALPDDLQWTDEFAPRVIQQLKTTLDTAPHIVAVARSKGVPVSLKSWTDGAWVSRATALLLQDAASQAGLSMPLVLRGARFQVMFRHHENNAFTAVPVRQVANTSDDDPYLITLNLITV